MHEDSYPDMPTTQMDFNQKTQPIHQSINILINQSVNQSTAVYHSINVHNKKSTCITVVSHLIIPSLVQLINQSIACSINQFRAQWINQSIDQ